MVSQQLGQDRSHPNPMPLEMPLMSPREPITQVCLVGHAAGRFAGHQVAFITSPTFPRALDFGQIAAYPTGPGCRRVR